MDVAELSVVRAEMPVMDGCRILNRLNAYVVNQGVTATLEHVWRDREGNPVDLSAYLQDHDSLSSSVPAIGRVVLRVKDWLGVANVGSCTRPIWEVEGEGWDAEAGVVRAKLTDIIVSEAGIYQLSWAVTDENDQILSTQEAVMSVERSMFSPDALSRYRNLGPPTLQEVRMMLMDSSRSENTLLQDVEFKDEQILLALTKPVEAWNEALPPIKTFTTRNFPWRGAWMDGVCGQLHMIMANHYRRNRLKHSAGGVTIDDKNKEAEYLQEGQRLWQKYIDWMLNKKISINIKSFFSSSLSQYSGGTGW